MLLRTFLTLWLLLHACSTGAVVMLDVPWYSTSGSAVALSIASDGGIMAVGRDTHLWYRKKAELPWSSLVGNAVRIAALPKRRYYAVRPDGRLSYFDGIRVFEEEMQARDVVVDAREVVYVVRNDGMVLRKSPNLGAKWEEIVKLDVQRVAVASDDSIWLALSDGGIRNWSDGKIKTIAGNAIALAASRDGTMLSIDKEGYLHHWDAFVGAWNSLSTPARMVAITLSERGIPWAAARDGTIYNRIKQKREKKPLNLSSDLRKKRKTAQGNGEEENVFEDDIPNSADQETSLEAQAAEALSRAASHAALNSSAQKTDPTPIQWTPTKVSASGTLKIAGKEGSVFNLDNAGNLKRWSNTTKSFNPFSAKFAKIAVDAEGNLWGINALGRIFRRTGAIWHQVIGTASDIAIGSKGQVMAVSAAGELSRYNPSTDAFYLLPPLSVKLVTLAIDSAAVPWGLMSDGTVVRCATQNCTFMARKAQSLSIGPDDSVFIVTQTGELQRLNAKRDGWELVPLFGQALSSVAAGPNGRPWVIAGDGQVFASKLFPRDESKDSLVAATTSAQTVGAGATAPVLALTPMGGGFTFTANMLFNALPTPAPVFSMAMGADGTLVLNITQAALSRYNTLTKVFTPVTGFPAGNIRTAFYGADATLWVLSADIEGLIYHQKQGNVFETIQVPIPNPSPPVSLMMNRALSVGPDGSIYLIDSAGILRARQVGTTFFTILAPGIYQQVAVPRTGDVWVIDQLGVVRQIINGVAVARSSGLPAIAIAGGMDGSVYILMQDTATGLAYPLKWNLINQSWDRINLTLGGAGLLGGGIIGGGVIGAPSLGVSPDGRVWIFDPTNPRTVLQQR